MLRNTLLKRSLFKPTCYTASYRALSFTPLRQYSILDSAKEKLDELNKKVGQAAASGIEQAEHAAETVAEKTHHVKETVEQTQHAFDAKGKEGLEEKAKEHLGSETVEKGKKTAENLKDKAEDLKKDVEDAAEKASKSFD